MADRESSGEWRMKHTGSWRESAFQLPYNYESKDS